MDGLTTLVDASVLIGGRAFAIPSQLGWTTSIVVIGELHAGVMMARDDATRAERLRRLTSVLDRAPILGIDHLVAARYGELRAAARRKPANDLWIAATALAHDLELLTADERQAALPLIRARLV